MSTCYRVSQSRHFRFLCGFVSFWTILVFFFFWRHVLDISWLQSVFKCTLNLQNVIIISSSSSSIIIIIIISDWQSCVRRCLNERTVDLGGLGHSCKNALGSVQDAITLFRTVTMRVWLDFSFRKWAVSTCRRQLWVRSAYRQSPGNNVSRH